MTLLPAGRSGRKCWMNFSPTPGNSRELFLSDMTNWPVGPGSRENSERNSCVKPIKTLAGLLLWSSLLPIVPLLAADLPVVWASYNAIGGVFTPLWVAQENKLFNKYGISV